jgi:hypothetical protein
MESGIGNAGGWRMRPKRGRQPKVQDMMDKIIRDMTEIIKSIPQYVVICQKIKRSIPSPSEGKPSFPSEQALYV